MLLEFCCQVYPVGTLHVRLKLPLAQFQYFFNHFNATNSMCDSARSGCTRVTTQLHKNSQLRNRTLNARTLTHELRTATGVNVADQTIRKRLCTRNLGPRRPIVRISHNRSHKRLHLYRCRHHLHHRQYVSGKLRTLPNMILPLDTITATGLAKTFLIS